MKAPGPRASPLVRGGFALLLGLAWYPVVQAGLVGDPILLYDDDSPASLASQGWLLPVSTLGTSPQPIAAGVRLDSRQTDGGTAGQAGLFSQRVLPLFPDASTPINPAFPSLDPWLGFTLGFQLQIHEERHLSGDRAGFSVILLGADRRGVELGFWGGRIWAQSDQPLFTQAEGAAFDTQSREVLYELSISGLDYLLRVDGVPLLRGATRDYRAFEGLIDPYQSANLVFLGDDTNSASALVSLGRVTLQIDDQRMEPIPLPPTWTLLIPGLAARARPWTWPHRRRAPSGTVAAPNPPGESRTAS